MCVLRRLFSPKELFSGFLVGQVPADEGMECGGVVFVLDVGELVDDDVVDGFGRIVCKI